MDYRLILPSLFLATLIIPFGNTQVRFGTVVILSNTPREAVISADSREVKGKDGSGAAQTAPLPKRQTSGQ